LNFIVAKEVCEARALTGNLASKESTPALEPQDSGSDNQPSKRQKKKKKANTTRSMSLPSREYEQAKAQRIAEVRAEHTKLLLDLMKDGDSGVVASEGSTSRRSDNSSIRDNLR
jgi:hypothetical protein